MSEFATKQMREIAFGDFQRRMIEHAKGVQGDNYAGDDYYLQRDCWFERFEYGDTA